MGSFYGDATTHFCEPCSEDRCTLCFGPTWAECTACDLTYYLKGNQCVDSASCGSHYYADSTGGSRTCQPCTGLCTECITASTTCTDCVDYFRLDGNTCNACMTRCMTCDTSVSTCDLCEPKWDWDGTKGTCWCDDGYGYFNLECLAVCPTGYYKDLTTRTCTLCESKCTACLTATVCTACNTALYKLVGSKCLCNSGFLYNVIECKSPCPNNFYGSTTSGECEACDSKCLVCFGAADT